MSSGYNFSGRLNKIFYLDLEYDEETPFFCNIHNGHDAIFLRLNLQ